MRVLVLTLWYPRPDNPGSGTYVLEQCRALRVLGVEIRVVQPVPWAPYPVTLFKESYRRYARTVATEQDQGFQLDHPRYLTFPRHLVFEHVGEWMYRALRRRVADLHAQSPIDIIHAHTTYPCGYAANLLRDRDFPTIKVVHTIHRTCIIDVPRYNRHCQARVRDALLGADRSVFVSLEGRSLGLEYTDDRIRDTSDYITNGVNVDQFQMSALDWAEVATLKAAHSHTWNLLFVGSIEPRKGIQELLSAVAQLRGRGRRALRLFLVGRNEMGPFVKRFTQSHGISEMVVEVGPVPHDRVKIWMNFADAFVLPSHSEGLPTVLFESLLSGVPSIFTRVGGVKDVVTDGREALLIAPCSVGAIVDSVARLMADDALCRGLVARGRALVREEFTWARNAERHMGLYERLLARD